MIDVARVVRVKSRNTTPYPRSSYSKSLWSWLQSTGGASLSIQDAIQIDWTLQDTAVEGECSMVPSVGREYGVSESVISEEPHVQSSIVDTEEQGSTLRLCRVLSHEGYVPSRADIQRIEPEVDGEWNTTEW